jgi:hypothetical protein
LRGKFGSVASSSWDQIRAGFFDGGIRIIPSLTEPQAAVQARFWNTDSGGSWETATVRGETDVFTVEVGEGTKYNNYEIPPALPGMLHGIQSPFPLVRPVVLDIQKGDGG